MVLINIGCSDPIVLSLDESSMSLVVSSLVLFKVVRHKE